MIVGDDILTRGLVIGGTAKNLKNSTYDLTVGEIIPIGKDAYQTRASARARREEPRTTYFLEPREMVWVLSKEEFALPKDVTWLATLRTTFTKQGILALNVGIIDPFFRGPISTALINFSDRPRPIHVGDKFFRVVFLEHADVTAHQPLDESLERGAYIRDLEAASYSDFAPSFLNIPTFDDKYYEKKFWSIIFSGLIKTKSVSIPVFIAVILVFVFLWHLGFGGFYLENLARIAEFLKKFTL